MHLYIDAAGGFLPCWSARLGGQHVSAGLAQEFNPTAAADLTWILATAAMRHLGMAARPWCWRSKTLPRSRFPPFI